MPDAMGILSKDDKQKVSEWLKKHWKESECPISKDNNWILGDRVVTLLSFGGGRVISGGDVYPLVMMICKTCGHTIFFNAIMIGLVPARGVSDGQ